MPKNRIGWVILNSIRQKILIIPATSSEMYMEKLLSILRAKVDTYLMKSSYNETANMESLGICEA